jgi:hypothetical protein
MLLDDNFSDSQCVHSISDRLDRLIHGLLTIRLFVRGLQPHRIGIRNFAGRRDQIPFRKTLVQKGAEIRVFAWIDAHHLKGIILGASHLAKDAVPLVQFLFDPVNGLIRLSTDRVIGDHLKNKVDAAFQIQTKLHVFLELLLARHETWIGYNSPYAQKCYGHNHYKSLEKTFIHVHSSIKLMSGPALNLGPIPLDLLLFGSLQCRDGISGNVDLDVLRYSELNPVVFESHYRTVNPTRSDDLIASFQTVDHLLKLLSLALCR